MAHFVYSPRPENKGINMDQVVQVTKDKLDGATNPFRITFHTTNQQLIWEYATKPKRDDAFVALRQAMQNLYPDGNDIS